MARELTKILETAQAGLTQQSLELSEVRARQRLSVTTKAATGSGNIDATFSLDLRYRLVFVRCHFAGGTGAAAFTISAPPFAQSPPTNTLGLSRGTATSPRSA